MRVDRLLVALAIASMTITVACSKNEPFGTEAAAELTVPSDAITKTTENGPVKATIKVWPAKPALGDAIYARLEIEAPPGVSINAPFQEAGDERLGRFKVVGFTRSTSAPGHQEQTYTLEAPSSGRHRIPPLRIEMLDARSPGSDAAKKPQELLTDEVPLQVAPVPSEVSDKALQPSLGNLDPDVGGTSVVWIVALAGGAVLLAIGGAFAVRSLRARRRILAQRSAYDEAVAELRSLEHRGPPDAETADAWFVKLSAIVRRYLEHRYDIRAPELTTEEFLQVATARPELTGEHRALLTSFLERCDRVKFAGYRPDADESIATLAAARGFVEDTRLREHSEQVAA